MSPILIKLVIFRFMYLHSWSIKVLNVESVCVTIKHQSNYSVLYQLGLVLSAGVALGFQMKGF